MVTEIRKLNEDSGNLWEGFVNRNPNSRIQHSLEWKKAIENSYKNCLPYYYFGIRGGCVKFIAPFFLVKSNLFGNRVISVPFIDCGGFLGKVDSGDIKQIIKEIEKEDKIRHIEIRLNSFMKHYKNYEKNLIKEGFRKESKRHLVIKKLKPPKEMWEGLSKNTKRMIKISEKNNLKIKEILKRGELEEFYRLYFKKMREFGAPPHSKKFFESLWEELSPEKIKGFGCYKEDKLIAAMVCYFEKNYVYYIYSVSTTDKTLLKLRPNEFIYWEFLKWSSEKGYEWFDFGQVDLDSKKGTHAEGLQKFKRKWCVKFYERPYFYYYFNKKGIKRDKKKDKLKKFRIVWRNLPQPIIKMIGPKIASELGI